MLSSQNRKLKLGPHEYNTKDPQAAVVVLPKKQKTTALVAPYAGTNSSWTGVGPTPWTAPARRPVRPQRTDRHADVALARSNGAEWADVPVELAG